MKNVIILSSVSSASVSSITSAYDYQSDFFRTWEGWSEGAGEGKCGANSRAAAALESVDQRQAASTSAPRSPQP